LYFNATEINEIEDLLRRADDLVGELAIFEIERESGKSIDTNLHNETFRELLAVSNKVLESYERARQQALYRLYIKLQTETGV
jgi:hypothetical protein